MSQLAPTRAFWELLIAAGVFGLCFAIGWFVWELL